MLLQDVKKGQAICVPCVYGQYCPRGSFQPPMGDSEATRLYVEKYLCRFAASLMIIWQCSLVLWSQQHAHIPLIAKLRATIHGLRCLVPVLAMKKALVERAPT